MAKRPIPSAPKPKGRHSKAHDDLEFPGIPPAPPRIPTLPKLPKPNDIPEMIKDLDKGLVKPPPLFIKIDKYREVISNIEKMKSFALSLRDTLDVLTDIEKEIQHGLRLAHNALDKFNTLINHMDKKMTHVQTIEKDIPKPEKEIEEEELDDFVKDLYNQMERIRGELNVISENS
jgi:hypothetical protein